MFSFALGPALCAGVLAAASFIYVLRIALRDAELELRRRTLDADREAIEADRQRVRTEQFVRIRSLRRELAREVRAFREREGCLLETPESARLRRRITRLSKAIASQPGVLRQVIRHSKEGQEVAG